jgi:hypothetical protein
MLPSTTVENFTTFVEDVNKKIKYLENFFLEISVQVSENPVFGKKGPCLSLVKRAPMRCKWMCSSKTQF